MGEKKEKLHLKWIDAAKGIAILAVVIDHSNGILYTNRIISLWSFFSVTVFVFLAGITSYYSSDRHKNESIGNEIIRKVKGIIIPYVIATCIYQLVIDNRLDFVECLTHILRFDISPPFYFVVFYIQLVIISPYIYRLINRWQGKKGRVVHCLMFAMSIFISIFCIRHTFILDVWGGGKYLLGGSYLIVYLLGEMSAHYGLPLRQERSLFKAIVATGAVIMYIVWLGKFEFKLDYLINEPFGTGLNPPGVTLMIYAMCIIAFLYYFFLI